MPIVNEKQHPLELRIPMPWGYVAGCWYGDRSKRPILALHGWQDNAGSFSQLAPLIVAHRSVLAVDMPGNGQSTHFPPGIHYHTLDYVGVIHRIVAFYKWKRVSLMGHSMGAALSYYYAALFPHAVDMVIAIDVIHSICFEPDTQIDILNYVVEKLLDEEDRFLRKPSMFEFSQLEQQLYEGTRGSVDLAHCKFLLERNVIRAEQYPDKFFLSFDRRIKAFFEQSADSIFYIELAKNIRNINYLIIKADHSPFRSKDNDEVLKILRSNNPNLELYHLPNTRHHMHLTQAELVAGYVLPFLIKYAPKDDQEPESMQEKCRL